LFRGDYQFAFVCFFISDFFENSAMARQLAVCGEGRMKMLTPGNNLLNKHIFTPYRHNVASAAPIKGLRAHSVFLIPPGLYEERISGYWENAVF
jgi:hypothetical protein